jgi:hypothetical protein
MVYFLLLAVIPLYAVFVLLMARFCGFNDSNGHRFKKTGSQSWSRIPEIRERLPRSVGSVGKRKAGRPVSHMV